MRTPLIPGLGLAAVLLTAALASCSGDEDPPPSTADAGDSTPDAGSPPVDSGTPDAGADSGTPDAGEDGDAGTGDAGTPDGGDAGPAWPPNLLSEWKLFTGSPAAGGLQPVEGNVPYTLTTPLFSDYSLKSRTLHVPPGKTAGYRAQDVLDLPVGTILTKTFSFPADLREPEKDVRVIETRVLMRQADGWEAYPYFWNEAQTEATLANGGRVVRGVQLIGEDGVTRTFDYRVPAKNECQKCHHVLGAGNTQVMVPIGVKARYLNRDNTYGGQTRNQLQHLADLGKLVELPALDEVPRAPDAFNPAAASLDERARTYLDINCAHCHNAKAQAGDTSRLFLDHASTGTPSLNMGICKRPGSAGGSVGGEFDIVPGDHAVSILWYRLDTQESGKMMPELGRAIRHVEGSRLVADWIDAMQPPDDCK